MKAAFVGYGELAQQIRIFVEEIFQPQSLTIFDDKAFEGEVKNAFPFWEFNSDQFNDHSFFVCLGYHHLNLRTQIIEELKILKRSMPSVIHPTAYVSPSAVLGNNVFIYPMCTIDKDVVVGDGTILNNGVIVSHNTVLGKSCYLSPGVTTSGFVSIGDQTFLGTQVAVTNHISIGSRCKVGIGSVVTHNLSDNQAAIGNPLVIKENGFNLI